MNPDSVGYYEIFPPKRMNASTKMIEVADPSGNKVLKRILVADKDFAAGEVIYIVTCYQFRLSAWIGSLIKTGATNRYGFGPRPRREGVTLFPMPPPD